MPWKPLHRLLPRRYLRARWSRLPMDEIVRSFGTVRDVDAYMQTCFRYVRDHQQHALDDHWQTPAQTLRSRRGDCEDWAVFAWHVLTRARVEARVLCTFTEERGHALCLARDGRRPVLVCNEGLREVPRPPHGAELDEHLARQASSVVFPDWTSCSYVHPESLRTLAEGRPTRPFDPRYEWIQREVSAGSGGDARGAPRDA